MRVWLINTSEMTPADDGAPRLRRTGLLAEALVEAGHEVLWWNATFQHSMKRQRFHGDTSIRVDDGYRIRFLRAPGYRRNISLARVWNHCLTAWKFRKCASAEQTPSLVVCSFPTIELSDAAVSFGRSYGVPVLLDIRDMWPDIFVQLVPRWCRQPVRLALSHLYRQARRACARADAISGHTSAFVDWALQLGQRPKTELDRDFPFGYRSRPASEDDIAKGKRIWECRGVTNAPQRPIICFFGAVGRQFDWKTLLAAARELERRTNVLFVICGVGDCLDTCRQLATGISNVLLPGFVSQAEIWGLMELSSLALAPYVQRADFEASIPNKAIEYLAGGLPILTSLRRGELPELLRAHGCGASYGTDGNLLACIILGLLNNRDCLQEMGQNARRLFESRFTAEEVYREMVRHLEVVSEQYGQVNPRSQATS